MAREPAAFAEPARACDDGAGRIRGATGYLSRASTTGGAASTAPPARAGAARSNESSPGGGR